MVATEDVESNLDLLIIGALAYGGRAWNRLAGPARRYAQPIIRGRGGDLPADLHEDVVQQALLNLFRTGADRLGPNKGRASALFGWCVREAIQQVRVAMAKPGNPTRNRGKADQPRATVMSWDEMAETMPKAVSTTRIDATEDRLDSGKILALAPPPVAQALRLIHFEDATLAAAAKAASLSRFQMSRRLFAFTMEMRAAA